MKRDQDCGALHGIISTILLLTILMASVLAEETPPTASQKLKQVQITMTDQKGTNMAGQFQPAGFKLTQDFHYKSTKTDKLESSPSPSYPEGVGKVLVTGCYKNNYQKGDPCYSFVTENPFWCHNLLDGVMFMGVGFDVRETYSAESRRKALLTQNCNEKRGFQGKDVPDNMLADGIYEYKVETKSYESLSSYQAELASSASVALTSSTFSKSMQTISAGVSGGFGPVSVGVKTSFSNGEESSDSQSSSSATSGSTASSSQKKLYLAVLTADINLYEIFQDAVKPDDLRLEFFREFMGLPPSYYDPGAPLLYSDFIGRWGTHYVSSAKFGGQLKIIKTMEATADESYATFEQRSQREFDRTMATMSSMSVQATVGTPWVSVEAGYAKSNEQGSSSGEAHSEEQQELSSSFKQDSYASTLFEIEGGDPEIAAGIFDAFSPSFREDFDAWIQSVPEYAKAFDFKLSEITDLLQFSVQGLMKDSCQLCEDSPTNMCVLTTQTTINCSDISTTQNNMDKRRHSLKRAIEVYMEEGLISADDTTIMGGDPNCEHNDADVRQKQQIHPTFDEIETKSDEVRIAFDMKSDLSGKIKANEIVKLKYEDNKWYVLNGRAINEKEGYAETRENKVVIKGLVLTYNPLNGKLYVDASDRTQCVTNGYNTSHIVTGLTLARAEFEDPVSAIEEGRDVADLTKFSSKPCNYYWTNTRRFEAYGDGRCIRFSAATIDSLYIVLAAVPTETDTWIHFRVSDHSVALYRGLQLVHVNKDYGARGQGSVALYQLYFVCVQESANNTWVLYGTAAEADSTSLQTWVDYDFKNVKTDIKYYTFGSGEASVDVMDVKVVPLSQLEFTCHGGLIPHEKSGRCIEKCHKQCHPDYPCERQDDPTACDKCLGIQMTRITDQKIECVESCPTGYHQEGNQCTFVSRDCSDYPGVTGVRMINPGTTAEPYPRKVLCEDGWTVMLKRSNGEVIFDQDWDTYKEGFGYPPGELYAGNELIHLLTSGERKFELRVELRQFDTHTNTQTKDQYSIYTNFKLTSESDAYRLKATYHSGTAGNGLSWNLNEIFSTKDKDHVPFGRACAIYPWAGGGWWYLYVTDCTNTILTAPYRSVVGSSERNNVWYSNFMYSQSAYISYAVMKIRPMTSS